MSKTLTISDRAEYNERRKRVKRWCDDRFQIGEDLIAIRDKNLYRDDYRTFEECCDKEFNVKSSHAYRLMEASEVKSSLGTSPIGDKITNEAQARQLVNVPAKKRVAVIKEAVKSGGVTAKSLGEAAKTVLAPEKPPEKEIVRDVEGYPVPKPALPAWNRRAEMSAILRTISDARSMVRKLDPEDGIFTEVNVKDVLASLNNAYNEFKQAIGCHVCGSCQGQTPKHCSLCKGRGIISDFMWKTCIPEEVKEMRRQA